jgi:predicted RNase H-like HicB family nuclease
MRSLTYQVVFEGSDSDGWSAYAPDLPGVVAAASTRDETRDLMQRAVQIHIEGMIEDGTTIPEPGVFETITVAAA